MSKLIFRLMSRHQQIDHALRPRTGAPPARFRAVAAAQKQKLAIKDRLAARTMGRTRRTARIRSKRLSDLIESGRSQLSFVFRGFRAVKCSISLEITLASA